MEVVNALRMAQILIRARLKTARCVVDATAGNGKDTLFIAANTPADSTVWAFDIQEQALRKTRELLFQNGFDSKVRLINDSHAKVSYYIGTAIDAAMFNLGYLPGGSHAINTQPENTIAALSQILSQLVISGIVTIVAYPGYEHGLTEMAEVSYFLNQLPQKEYCVACWSMVNQINHPPLLYIVERVSENTQP
ncbi:putative rRNA methylase [Methylomusa anaerophila]|uniref:Putative rRNA methylase n=2 Tax=Methylomusa anaerophila TaxID=1930071 RepID=A0A348APC9_9FIRM|nr:putative rRNA methylase [Methylomusa anaerophila]